VSDEILTMSEAAEIDRKDWVFRAPLLHVGGRHGFLVGVGDDTLCRPSPFPEQVAPFALQAC
jgi:hypothetical protein